MVCCRERGKQLAVEAQQPKGGAVSFPSLLFSFPSFLFSLHLPNSLLDFHLPFMLYCLLPPHPYPLLYLQTFSINFTVSTRLSYQSSLPLSFSHLSFFLGHFTSRPSEIPLSDLPIHLVIFQQVERQSHSRLCRPRSCTSCP